MSSAAPLSSVPPQSVARAVNKPGNVSYVNNPMSAKPAVKPAGMFDWLMPREVKPVLSSSAPAAGGRRRRGGKKTQRKNRAKKTRRRH